MHACMYVYFPTGPGTGTAGRQEKTCRWGRPRHRPWPGAPIWETPPAWSGCIQGRIQGMQGPRAPLIRARHRQGMRASADAKPL